MLLLKARYPVCGLTGTEVNKSSKWGSNMRLFLARNWTVLNICYRCGCQMLSLSTVLVFVPSVVSEFPLVLLFFCTLKLFQLQFTILILKPWLYGGNMWKTASFLSLWLNLNLSVNLRGGSASWWDFILSLGLHISKCFLTLVFLLLDQETQRV